MPRRRGRPSKQYQKTNVNLDQKVYDELSLYLVDPFKGKLQYGALSKIVNGLLEHLLEHLRKEGVHPSKVFEAYGVDVNLEEHTE